MRPLCCVIALLGLFWQSPARANPVEVEKIVGSFKREMEDWTKRLSAAENFAEREALAAKGPDAAAYARRMWQVIGPALDREWALDGMAWFISVAANLRTEAPVGGGAPEGDLTEVLMFQRELNAVAEAVSTRHQDSAGLAVVCLAYSRAGDPASLRLLEKIESGHKLKSVQGVAALAIATRLRTLGDAPELMGRRLNLLKKAIIEAADVKVQGVELSQLIQEELYVLTNLTKGRPAPQLAGVDSAGRPMRLSDYRGKVVVLLFWNSSVPGVVALLESVGKISRESGGRAMVLGVNNDRVESLRIFQQKDADLLEFPNFSDPAGELVKVYRVGEMPLAYVLDTRGAIAYAGPPGAFMQAAVHGLLEGKPAADAAPARE